MLPRNKWRYSNDNKAMERCRLKANRVAASSVLKLGGCYIKHPDLLRNMSKFLMPDGVHLNELGNKLFLNNFQGGLEFFQSQLGQTYLLVLIKKCRGISTDVALALTKATEAYLSPLNCEGGMSNSCCVNQYLNEVNNSCTECPYGNFGINCKQSCPPGYYGRLCRSSCECDVSECHHVTGCTTTDVACLALETVHTKNRPLCIELTEKQKHHMQVMKVYYYISKESGLFSLQCKPLKTIVNLRFASVDNGFLGVSV
uniref:Uncharacterized protein n=1 Tax=Magallana gigas TaxID=29159 RepID=K1PRX3_MAGGI